MRSARDPPAPRPEWRSCVVAFLPLVYVCHRAHGHPAFMPLLLHLAGSPSQPRCPSPLWSGACPAAAARPRSWALRGGCCASRPCVPPPAHSRRSQPARCQCEPKTHGSGLVPCLLTQTHRRGGSAWHARPCCSKATVRQLAADDMYGLQPGVMPSHAPSDAGGSLAPASSSSSSEPAAQPRGPATPAVHEAAPSPRPSQPARSCCPHGVVTERRARAMSPSSPTRLVLAGPGGGGSGIVAAALQPHPPTCTQSSPPRHHSLTARMHAPGPHPFVVADYESFSPTAEGERGTPHSARGLSIDGEGDGDGTPREDPWAALQQHCFSYSCDYDDEDDGSDGGAPAVAGGIRRNLRGAFAAVSTPKQPAPAAAASALQPAPACPGCPTRTYSSRNLMRGAGAVQRHQPFTPAATVPDPLFNPQSALGPRSGGGSPQPAFPPSATVTTVATPVPWAAGGPGDGSGRSTPAVSDAGTNWSSSAVSSRCGQGPQSSRSFWRHGAHTPGTFGPQDGHTQTRIHVHAHTARGVPSGAHQSRSEL